MTLLLAGLAIAVPGARGAASDGALDSRAWEMVSPVEKNGGEVAPLGQGALAGAAQGGAVAFASEASFGEAAGAAPLSQYLASRSGGGWSSANVTPPLLSGTYAPPRDPDPYLLFSADLSRAVLSSGWACRDGSGEACEAEAPPLGPGGPAGYRNAYLYDGTSYQPLITLAGFPDLPAAPDELHLDVQGADPDLHHVAFATETGLYLWSEGAPQVTQLSTEPSAALAAGGIAFGAVSETGARAYFSEGTTLRLRDGAATKTVCESCAFGAASADGAVAFYLKSAHLHRYLAATEADEDLTPSGGASAILAASPDGATLFYVATGGIYRWRQGAGAAVKVVSAANLTHLPPTTGPAALAASGSRLFFTSSDPLLPLSDSNGRPDAYEWEAQGTGSCAKSPGCLGLLSSGRSGEATFATASASGEDAYFLTAVSLLPADTDGLPDLYDARAGGGFPEPGPGIECNGDDCQGPPFVPQDPPPATSVVSGPENPPLKTSKKKCPKGKRKVVRKGKTRCVRKHRRQRQRRGTRR